MLRQENARQKHAIPHSSSSGSGASKSTAHFAQGDDGQLRDANWRLQQLQTQYDFLVSKTSSQSQAFKQMEEQHDESAQKIRELRRALEELRHEKDASDAKAEKSDELSQLVSELRHANRSLEDKISRLCEAPFINDAFGQQESRMRFEDANKDREDYRAKVNHLQEAVRTHFSALTSLKQHANQLREDKDAAERMAEEWKTKYHELELEAGKSKDQLRLYSGEDGLDIQQLERALTLVKRREEVIEKLPFLEDPENEKMVTLPVLKRKLEEVQVMNLKLTEEVERFESMLKMQSGINRDLHKELEALVHKRDKDKRELQQRADDLEELAKKRLEKIHSMEAQIRQLVYGMSKGKKAGGQAILGPGVRAASGNVIGTPVDTASVGASDAENALLNELIEERGGELLPDENLLEVWIKSATIAEGALPSGCSTFVVIDFFDYESQTTSFLTGFKPQWDFAATYKITVDDFLLRYLATDVITLELNTATQGDYSMLARCTVPISSLLRSKPLIKLTNHPMISVKTGEIIAHMTMEIRLAIPVSELYRLFLERHPSERRHIEEVSTKLVLDAASNLDRAQHASAMIPVGAEDESRLYNELEISILSAKGLPAGRDGKFPTAYVHFQFLGHPDKYTNPVPNSADPTFNERFSFPMVTNDQQLRLLQRSKLEISIIDMKGQENDDENEGLLGTVFVNLAEMADSMRAGGIEDTFSIKDAAGKRVADLKIALRWKHTFRRQRELGPRALSGIEVETLITAFSASDISEGVVDYRAFCRFIDPPREVRRVMESLRAFCTRRADRESSTTREVFGLLLEDHANINEETFVQKMELTKLEALPEDFRRLFQFVDMDEDNNISLDQFLAVLNLDEVAGVPGALQDKLRERSRDLEARGIYILRLFEDADQWGANGMVTRMEFKGVLKRMGFQLADEPEERDFMEVDGRLQSHRRSNGEPIRGFEQTEEDILNDTMGSGDDVLIHTDPDAPQSHGAAGGGNKARYEAAKQQRELFDNRTKQAMEQRQSMQQHIKEPVVGRNILGAENNDPNLAKAKGGKIGQTPEELAADPFGGNLEHRTAVSSNAASARPYDAKDAAQLDLLATKLQATVRGHQSRTSPEKDSEKPPIGAVVGGAGRGELVSTSDKPADILQAENSIRKSLKALQGIQPEPNLLGGFQTVDSKRLGYVNRQQFAHVMKQFESIQLYGTEMRACMDYFDRSNDGTQIDYAAFVRLCRYREPDLLPAVQWLQKMALGPESIFALRAYDTAGHGYIKRSDMMRALGEMGHGHISSATMLSMLELFETKIEGQVNYGNFVEYIRENAVCTELEAVSTQLYQMIAQKSNNLDEKSLREWFKKIDTEGKGKFGVQQLGEFLVQYDFKTSKEVVSALMSIMNKGSAENHYSDFASWLRSIPSSKRTAETLFSNPTIAELQRKSNAYMLAVAKSGAISPSLEEISSAYQIYDWNAKSITPNAIGKSTFIRATKRAGFVFTQGEMKMLASEFKLNDGSGKIEYRKFLAWATPDANPNVRSSAVSLPHKEADIAAATIAPRNTASGIIRFLETKYKAGIDLLSVFGRYDSSGVGRITADEMCNAISELGLSSTTQRDSIEVADRFKAVAGNFVMYRRVVQELLRHIDEATGASSIDVVDTVRAALQRSRVELRRLRDVFEYYDRKSSGKVREEDLGTVFEEAHVRLKRQELDAIVDRYSSGGGVQYASLLSALESRIGEGPITSKSTLVSEELAIRLREFFEALIMRGKDFRHEFDRMDEDFTGSIKQGDFREVIQERLRANLTSKELEVLEKAFRDPSDPRKVSFTKFLNELHPRQFSKRAAGELAGEESQVWEIAENLRQKIRKRCDYAAPGELKRPFKHFARRKGETGASLDDLALSLRDLGMRIAGDQIKSLFDMMNLNSNSKAFTYTDFVVFVRDPLHADIVWKLRRLISRSRTSEKEMTDALNDQDTNGSNLITATQFQKAMKSCNVELSESDVARLLLRFDTEEVHRLDIEKFVRFLRGQPTEQDELGQSNDTHKTAHDVETVAWTGLKRRVEDKLATGFTPNEIYAMFDVERRGTLDLASLQQGAREIGAQLSRPEARAVLRRMSLLSGGPVEKGTFFECLKIDTDRNKIKARRSLEIEERSSYQARGSELHSTCQSLRERLERVADRTGDEPEEMLRKALNRASIEKAGAVNQEELIKAFDALGLHATRRDTSKIVEALDPDLTEYIKISALINAMLPDSSRGGGAGGRYGRDSRDPYDDDRTRSHHHHKPGKAAAVFRRRPDLLESVTKNVHAVAKDTRANLDDLLRDFKKSDRSRAGELERGEFSRVLARFGFKMLRAEERDLVDSLGEGESGIDYADFIEALRGEASKEEQVDDVIVHLRNRISRDLKHGKTLESEFYDMDRNGDGELDVNELEMAMNKMGIPLSREESKRVMNKFSAGGNTIRYRDFIIAMNPASSEASTADAIVRAMIDRLQHKIEERLGTGGPGSSRARQLREVFEDMNERGDGKLSEGEFRKAMTHLKIDVDREDVALIFKRYDDSGNGKLDFNSFMHLVDFAPNTDKSSTSYDRRGDRAVSDKLVDRIRRRLEDNLGSSANSARKIKETFTDMDTDNSNYIDKREFMNAMDVLRVEVSRDEVDAIFDRFDVKYGGKKLDYSEFIALLGFHKAASADEKR